MRFVSHPSVETETHQGRFLCVISRMVLDVEPGGQLTFAYETIGGNSAPLNRIEQLGGVLERDADGFSGEVRRTRGGDPVSVTVKMFDEYLVMHLEAGSTDMSSLLHLEDDSLSITSALATITTTNHDEIATRFPPPDDPKQDPTDDDAALLPSQPDEEPPARTWHRDPVELPHSEVSDEDFDKFLAKVNRQLKSWGGREEMIDLEALGGFDETFLRTLAGGPFEQLRDIARSEIREFYAAAGRKKRLLINICGWNPPAAPGASWEIALGETARDGEATMVFECVDWKLVDWGLVG